MPTVPVLYTPDEMVRGDDGHLYHLPTLRTLYAAGKLPADSPGYRALLTAATDRLPRMLA